MPQGSSEFDDQSTSQRKRVTLWQNVSLVPRPPPFFFVRSWFCVQYNTHKWKSDEKMGKAWEHLLREWCTVDVGGAGPRSNNVLDLPLSNPMIARTPEPRGSQDQQHLTSPVRNSLYRVWFLHTSVQMGNAPPTSTWSHSRDRCSQVFPVFCRSSASEYYAERKPKNKEQENGGSLGKRLKIVKSPKWKDNIWTAPHISAPFFLGQCY